MNIYTLARSFNTLTRLTCEYVSKKAMTYSTENATPTKPSYSRHLNSLVRIQIKPQCQFEFVLRETHSN